LLLQQSLFKYLQFAAIKCTSYQYAEEKGIFLWNEKIRRNVASDILREDLEQS
jgi:hypothetical protein